MLEMVVIFIRRGDLIPTGNYSISDMLMTHDRSREPTKP